MYDLSCKQTLTSRSSIISKEVTSATATQHTLEKLNPGRCRQLPMSIHGEFYFLPCHCGFN